MIPGVVPSYLGSPGLASWGFFGTDDDTERETLCMFVLVAAVSSIAVQPVPGDTLIVQHSPSSVTVSAVPGSVLSVAPGAVSSITVQEVPC